MCHTSADYAEDLYQAFHVAEKREQHNDAMQELHDMIPLPMNTMLVKQLNEEAIQKSTERNEKTVQDLPPTTPGNVHIKICNIET